MFNKSEQEGTQESVSAYKFSVPFLWWVSKLESSTRNNYLMSLWLVGHCCAGTTKLSQEKLQSAAERAEGKGLLSQQCCSSVDAYWIFVNELCDQCPAHPPATTQHRLQHQHERHWRWHPPLAFYDTQSQVTNIPKPFWMSSFIYCVSA